MPWDPPRTIGSMLLVVVVSVTTTLGGLWLLSLIH